MTVSLTHIAQHVRDVDACVDFYQRYAGLLTVHIRRDGSQQVVWLAEPGREDDFILVLLSGGLGLEQAERDYSHLGFAVASREAVDRIAQQAEAEGLLVWGCREDAYPVGYYCGVRDPDGKVVEFSYGQPLGPGAEEAKPPSSSKNYL